MKPAVAGVALICITLAGCAAVPSTGAQFDLVIRGGSIYDGTGASPFIGDVAIRGDRIAYVGPRAPAGAKRELNATGQAVSPGFINQMSYASESFVIDGRGLSDLYQGVTLEVMNEGEAPGPLRTPLPDVNPFGTTLSSFFEGLERRGVAQNMAAHVGATAVRRYVLGDNNVAPTPAQLDQMRALVKEGMEQGAVGISSALIYTPATFSMTDELTALATEAGRCGGFYISHMRSEGARFIEALDELIQISRSSGAPAEVFHIKAGGQRNWSKMEIALEKIRAARAAGLRIRANMYPYPASGTGLDASMPPWVREGGLDAWIERPDLT